MPQTTFQDTSYHHHHHYIIVIVIIISIIIVKAVCCWFLDLKCFCHTTDILVFANKTKLCLESGQGRIILNDYAKSQFINIVSFNFQCIPNNSSRRDAHKKHSDLIYNRLALTFAWCYFCVMNVDISQTGFISFKSFCQLSKLPKTKWQLMTLLCISSRK